MKQVICILAVIFSFAVAICAQDATPEKAAPQPAANDNKKVNEEEAAIQKAIASYKEAFNKGDAKALAAHWSEQGEFITPEGKTLRGHKQLEADFTAYFQGAKNAKIELVDTAIKFLSPNVAVETGCASVIVPEQAPNETEYEAVHVKTDAGWKIDSVREKESQLPPPSHFEQLQELAWMVGQWSDTDDKADIRFSCRWTRNQNFLVQTFKVYVEGRVDFEGTQVIGWDPHAQAIRSWMFDSDGGFGAGRWSGGNGRWSVQMLSVLPDGRRGSATNLYELVDENTVRYRSIGRQVDGELMPSVGSVTVVREKK